MNEDDLARIINCKFAFEVWNILIVTHEGTSQVKRAKVDLLRSQYENFYMFENESIDDMLTRFTKITNALSSLGDKIDNDQKIRKVIRALPKAWEVKATTLKELNDKEEMDFSGFIGNLKTHEMEMKLEKRGRHQRRRRLPSKPLLLPLRKTTHPKIAMRISPCSSVRWARCSTRREEKVTSEEGNLKEDSRRKERSPALAFIARRSVTS